MRFSVFLSIHGLVLLWCASVAAFIVSTGVYRPGFKVNTLTSLPEQFLYPNSNKNCRYDRSRSQIKMEVFEGNPVGKKIWDMVWNLKIMQGGEQGSPPIFGDSAQVLKRNIEQIYGNEPSVDGAPLAEGEIESMTDGTAFLGLQRYYNNFGPVYKLCFGPKSFIVVSDPVIMKYILKTNSAAYDKGILAEILEPIMGKGLIPADPETWKVRRRAIVPGFHQQWLNYVIKLFTECNNILVSNLDNAAEKGEVCEMETLFCSVSLDIIGKAVFNYDFNSVTKESPVIQAVYSTLKEAEHRSTVPFPYWNLPLANLLVPRLRKFNSDLRLLNNVLDDLIDRAMRTKTEADLDALENRNYEESGDASLLRFLVDLRGEDSTSKQLRDDLMTMLIAGHETTAAVLTWAIFELAQAPEVLAKVQKEIDQVLGDPITGKSRNPTLEDIKKMQMVRLVVAESLRMYPEPPLLIRRALHDHELPKGMADFNAKIIRGCDLFLSIYNIHRSEDFWENPNKFDPERFLRPYKNPKFPEWDGYDPTLFTGLYPNEIASDFAFLPFGGGTRKCVGDQFALLEATVTLAMILRRFEFEFVNSPEDVGMRTGATIHTRNGLYMKVKRRENINTGITDINPADYITNAKKNTANNEKTVTGGDQLVDANTIKMKSAIPHAQNTETPTSKANETLTQKELV